jgi:ribosome-associated translation inhibitor RaiA
LQQLATEYENQTEIRSEQCVSLENQWKTYQIEQKKNRKKEIDERQIEFNAELDKEYQNDLRSFQAEVQINTCQQLIEFLEEQQNQQVSIVKVPVDLLQQFWTLKIHVPVLLSEIPDTINELKNIEQVSL